MNQPFFITGLPQSRTAWLSNLFTTGPVFCHHDLLGKVSSIAEFCERLSAQAIGSVGDSDSALLSAYSQAQAAFPAAPWVLVVRPFPEAFDSLSRFIASGPWQNSVTCSMELYAWMEEQWNRVRPLIVQNPRCLEVSFESLDTTDTIERIWHHCVPGETFDRRRAEALQTLTVRPNQQKTELNPQVSLVRELHPMSNSKG